MIEFKNVSKIYNIRKNENVALDDISFTLPDRGLVFITGKSGSGKSTILNLLGSLDTPTKGEILIDGFDISKLKGKKLSNYRNNYVGFVFQDFNLLEDFDVFDNIALSLDIKGGKYSKSEIEDTLGELGIQDLANRKIGQISGGECQRVSIARAIIKDPKILICDEPTGNLDSLNSEAIFKILKNISKDRLVVVVTHDAEAAESYGDMVLKIVDGKCENAVSIDSVHHDLNFDFKTSHISLLKKIKISYSNFKTRRIRLIITYLLALIAFTSFGLSTTLNDYDENSIHAASLAKENKGKIYVYDKKYPYYQRAIFSEDTISKLNEIDSDIVEYAKVYSDDERLYVTLSEITTYKDEYDDDAYYNIYIAEDSQLVEIHSEESMHALDIVGEYPSSPDEVLITQRYAEYLASLKFIYKDKDGKIIEEKTYETEDDVIGIELPFKDLTLKVTGYLKDDTYDKFDSLKGTSLEEMLVSPTELYEEYEDFLEELDETSKINRLIVTDDFFSNPNLKENKRVSDYFLESYYYEDDKGYPQGIEKLNKEITIYDGSKKRKISNLNGDEIVLTTFDISSLYSDEYRERWLALYKKLNEDYQKQMLQYELKIEEYTAMSIEDPDFVWPSIKEPTEPDYNKEEFNLAIAMMKENSLFGSQITLEITDPTNVVQEEKTKEFTFTVVGLIGNESDNLEIYSYVSNALDDYILGNKQTTEVVIYESDEAKLKSILDDFSDHDKITLATEYSDVMSTVTGLTTKIVYVLKIVSAIFWVFATVLLSNYIYTSITTNKKKIGILRSMGAGLKDCIDIFLLENVILGAFIFVGSCVLLIALTNLANVYTTNSIGFYMSIFSYNNYTFLCIILALLLSVILSSIVPTIKIARMKPIDAIYKTK